MKQILIKFISGQGRERIYTKELEKTFEGKYEFIVSDDPEYVVSFASIPDFLEYDCIRIQIIGENLRPDFNLCDYAIGFDSIKYEDRYLRWPLYADYETFALALNKHELKENMDYLNRDFCSFVVSNGNNADIIRDEFLRRLEEYRHVASGGRYMNNVGGPVDDKIEFQNKYKFSVAFENTATNGYITEKIIDSWAAKTVPIYFGAKDITKEFNSKAFINYADYGSIDKLIKRVREVDEDDDEYMSILHAPICLKESRANQYIDRTGLHDFFDNIFSQDYADAKRIQNKYFWGRDYENRLREYDKMKKSKLVHVAYCIDSKFIR